MNKKGHRMMVAFLAFLTGEIRLAAALGTTGAAARGLQPPPPRRSASLLAASTCSVGTAWLQVSIVTLVELWPRGSWTTLGWTPV